MNATATQVHNDDKVTTIDGRTYRVIGAPTPDEQRDYPDVRVWCVAIDDPDHEAWPRMDQIAKAEKVNW